MQLSPCFGTYTHQDETCNGQPGVDGVDGQPCSSRVKCYALTSHCLDTGTDRTAYLSFQLIPDDPATVGAVVPHRQGEFDELVEAHVREHRVGVESGVVRSGALDKSLFNNRRRRQPRPFCTLWLRCKETKDLFTAWREALARYLPQHPLQTPPGAIVPGNVVEDDELQHQRRVTYQLQLRHGKRLVLARLQAVARADVLDICLPLSVQEVEAINLRVGKNCQRTKKSRSLKSVVPDVDLARVPHVCELLAVAVCRGLIDIQP